MQARLHLTAAQQIALFGILTILHLYVHCIYRVMHTIGQFEKGEITAVTCILQAVLPALTMLGLLMIPHCPLWVLQKCYLVPKRGAEFANRSFEESCRTETNELWLLVDKLMKLPRSSDPQWGDLTSEIITLSSKLDRTLREGRKRTGTTAIPQSWDINGHKGDIDWEWVVIDEQWQACTRLLGNLLQHRKQALVTRIRDIDKEPKGPGSNKAMDTAVTEYCSMQDSIAIFRKNGWEIAFDIDDPGLV